HDECAALELALLDEIQQEPAMEVECIERFVLRLVGAPEADQVRCHHPCAARDEVRNHLPVEIAPGRLAVQAEERALALAFVDVINLKVAPHGGARDEMARIWLDVDRDAEPRVPMLRGAGKGFSAGGDMAMVDEMTRDFATRARVWREARDLVYNMLNCSKIIISAVHGPAVGAGLAAALMADISIASKNARLIDGHTRLGVAAGDHAAIIWPLLCGMAKAKYYLLTSDEINGEEAERLGLVSLTCEKEKLLETALEVARKLA